MIEIKLSKLMNSTPVGYLTDGLWITKGGKVLPMELNEFADYELTNNPNPESIKLEYPDYERLTFDYFATLPKTFDMRSQVTKHLEGQHDQSSHGKKGNAKFTSKNYDRLTGASGSEFQAAIADLGISTNVAKSAEVRFVFRSMPTKMMEKDFVELDKQLNALTSKNPVSIMTEEEVFESILDDGEVKSIFAFDADAKGLEYLEHRTVYEKVAFGYDQDLPVGERPISGIVYPSDLNDELIDTFGSNYGSVQLVLKDNVKSRTTTTIGDSLDAFQRPISIGEKVPRTVDLAYHAQNATKATNKGKNMLTDKTWWSFNYVEAQVHGGVKLNDISKVVFHYPEELDIEAVTGRLDGLGIDWEVFD
jgi:hypothetical protein